MIASAAVLSLLSGGLSAQDEALPAVPQVLTLDQERLFAESAFGRAVLERERVALKALEDENKEIEAELVREELELTELRLTLAAEEFSTRADAFNARVERIRTEQDAKARALTDTRETDRTAFLRAAIPALGELLSEKQGYVIVDKSTIILSLSAIDVTDAAIAKVDAVLGAGTSP